MSNRERKLKKARNTSLQMCETIHSFDELLFKVMKEFGDAVMDMNLFILEEDGIPKNDKKMQI